MTDRTLLVEDVVEYDGHRYKLEIVEYERGRVGYRTHTKLEPRHRIGSLQAVDDDRTPQYVSDNYKNRVDCEERSFGLLRSGWNELDHMTLEEQAQDLIDRMQAEWDEHDPKSLAEVVDGAE